MTKTRQSSPVSRRSLLGTGGALVVSVGMPVGLDTVLAIKAAAAQGAAARPPLLPNQLSSYIAVNADGSIAAFLGKMDLGQGLFVAIGQMVAEELDVPFKAVKVTMGDTATTVNQGGASGSTGVHYGGWQLRAAAAEARRVLVEMAVERLKLPADQLIVTDGVVHAKDDPAKSVSYAELIGGRYFNVQLNWNKRIGNFLYAPGKAQPKKPGDYKIVGQSIAREDVAPMVYGTMEYCTDVVRPNMAHGRMIRPAIAGAVPVAVDGSSIKDIPGAQMVWQGGFLGVVADKEWDAIRASRQLKVRWSDAKPPFVNQATLYDHIRRAPVRKRQVEAKTIRMANQGLEKAGPTEVGNVDEAFKNAARIIEAEYEWPFQSHASMGPACAVVEIGGNGDVTCWTGSQKPHFVQMGIARTLGIATDKVRAIWVMGPGSYGRNDADDAAMDAAILANATGRTVRMQYMRGEGTGWDPKAPASIHRARAALDAAGNVVGYEFNSKGFSRIDVYTQGSEVHDTLAGHLRGVALKSGDYFGVPSEFYVFANKRTAWETIPPLLDRASPLRTAHLRDPTGLQIQFASEQFMDELAAALTVDPVEFRLRHLKSPRDVAVVKAAAEKSGWQPRPSPRRDQRGNAVSGRGIAYSSHNGTIVAIVAEVEVDLTSGRIWARKMTVAHDCGQIINPDGLRHTIEGNIVLGISRTLWEEVNFDESNVTSVDWNTYPILDITETPDAIDIVMLNHPELPPTGAGDRAIRPVSGAIANAVFDATGVRIRRAPLSPERVKAALS